MPAQLQAQQMVKQVRDAFQIFQNGPVLRDGFPDDPLDDDGLPWTTTDILTYLNETMRQLQLETGYVKCREAVTLAPGTFEYMLSQGTGLNVDATIAMPGNDPATDGYGISLDRTTIGKQDLVSRAWQDMTTQQRGKPSKYMTTADILYVSPCPDQAYVVYLLADTLTADLIDRLSVPTRIPNIYVGGIVDGTVLRLNEMIDIENQLSEKRIAPYNDRWTKCVAGLKQVVNGRGDDYDITILVQDPRKFFMRGVSA